MRCDNCRCRVSQIEADRAAEEFSGGVTLCESCATGMRTDEKQLRVWCDVHRGEPITDAGEVPACLDWYPVVDSDGDLTGDMVSAQDTDYRFSRHSLGTTSTRRTALSAKTKDCPQ